MATDHYPPLPSAAPLAPEPRKSHKIRNIVVAAVAAVALAGGGVAAGLAASGGEAPEPKAPVTAPEKDAQPIAPEPKVDADLFQVGDIYLEVVRAEYPEMKHERDADMIDYGRSVCEVFDTGGDLGTIVNIAAENDFPVDKAMYMAGAAVPAFCPEYEDLVLDGS